MRAPCQLFDACAETDQEPHFVKLNRTSIAFAPFLFYTIICIEVSFCLISIMLLPFLCSAVLKAVVIHRNFRYQLCLASCYYVLGACGRLVLLPYQLLEWHVSVRDPTVFVCDLLRDMVMGYFCSILGSFAIERTIATHFWKWYELATPSTILVLIGAELTFLIPLTTGGTLCLLSIVTITSNTAVYAIMFTISTSVFLRTYFTNVAILAKMETGASIGDYFVAKRFQVRENVHVMKYMFRIAQVPACLAVPAFGCFALKMYGPIQWLEARNIAYAFFDLLIASVGLSFMISVIVGNRTVRTEFLKHYFFRLFSKSITKKRRRSVEGASVRVNHNKIADAYFSQLTNSWTKI